MYLFSYVVCDFQAIYKINGNVQGFVNMKIITFIKQVKFHDFMAIERSRSKRKVTGGRLVAYRKGRQFAVVNKPILTKIGTDKTKAVRSIGGKTKTKLISVQKISVANPKTKKVEVAQIETVLENKANRNYQIRNILNKGTLVKTKLGTVKITSRPGQSATLSGILIE